VIYIDSPLSDGDRRARLFTGDIFIFSRTPGTQALIDFAQEMAREAFAPHFPPDAQHKMGAQEYVDVLAKLKPAFINHPRCKEIIREIFADLGVDPEQTHFDVPRLRTMTSDYLNAGLTYQFHAHRDTWFSAPLCQLNWWLPVYDVTEANVMAFHPHQQFIVHQQAPFIHVRRSHMENVVEQIQLRVQNLRLVLVNLNAGAQQTPVQMARRKLRQLHIRFSREDQSHRPPVPCRSH